MIYFILENQGKVRDNEFCRVPTVVCHLGMVVGLRALMT